MKYINKKELMELCKIQIMQKSGFDENQELSHKDFEYLCYLIEEKSKINLSISTLKRIWKNEYDRIPQESTLDALAWFIDYESWKAFRKAALIENNLKTKSKKKVPSLKILKKKSILLYFISPICIILLTFIIIQFNKKDGFNKINTEDVIFRSYGTIETGVPNTVVFEYNIDNIDADSFFIQLTWDKNGRFRIYKNNYFYTTLYFYPDIMLQN